MVAFVILVARKKFWWRFLASGVIPFLRELHWWSHYGEKYFGRLSSQHVEGSFVGNFRSHFSLLSLALGCAVD